MLNLVKCSAVLLMTTSTMGFAICESAKSTREIDACLQTEIAKADSELASTYNDVVKELTAKDQDLLKQSQKSWQVFKNNELSLVASLWSEGTYSSIRFGYAKYDLTKARTKSILGLTKP